tara:strand:- start:1385 stop:1954 length:570 start_codon:yes stop_codon:yes gene_type:complete
MTETNWTQRKEKLSNDFKALNAQAQKAEAEGALALAASDTKSADDCFNRCDGIVREMKRIESAISACNAHIKIAADKADEKEVRAHRDAAAGALKMRSKCAERMDDLAIRFDSVFAEYIESGDTYRTAMRLAGIRTVSHRDVAPDVGLSYGFSASAPTLCKALGLTPAFSGSSASFTTQVDALPKPEDG